MSHDEARLARQEFLEAFSISIGGPAAAPMPGILLEMLEIAAMERKSEAGAALSRPAAKTHLTSPRFGRPIAVWCVRAAKVIAHVAGRSGSGRPPRQLPV